MIDMQLIGDEAVVLHLRGIGKRAQGEIVAAMGRVALALARESTDFKLSGQVLKAPTGTLKRSVTQSKRVYVAGTAVIATVGLADITGKGGRAPVKYGAAHEYGFSGVVSVKAHLRHIREQTRIQMFKTSASKDFGVFRKVRGKLTGGTATVSAHTRRVQLPERSFLRSALRDLNARGVPREEIEQALERALR